MQTQFGGSVSAGPALLNLNDGGPVELEAAHPAAPAAPAPPTTVDAPPAMDEADNTSIQCMPLWALALRQGSELGDAVEVGRGPMFEETFASKAAGDAEATHLLPLVSPMIEPDSADASSTVPQPEPPWATSLWQ